MSVNVIDASLLQKMFLAGAKRLESEKEVINELNVFPVPDGDTGTNMTMTVMSAATAVSEITNPDMKTVSKAISSGSLRGARGNSGVILSQLFRGFTKGIADYSELNTVIICDAMQRAVETAYKAVMKPKEGTILTVARGMAEKALEIVDTSDDLESYMIAIIEAGDATLAKTPDMLPVLKQAGVVDSGGQGLMEIMKGALDVLQGKEIDYTISSSESSASASSDSGLISKTKYTYNVSVTTILAAPLEDQNKEKYTSRVSAIGEGAKVEITDTMINTTINTNDPGLVLQSATKYGMITNVVVENMKLSDEQKAAASAPAAPAEPPKEMGFVSVATGDGICSIFKDLGVDEMISGGQTMNPSTDDILNAVAKVNAKTVFVLPNNKNIILAAEQAAKISKDKQIVVIPTKTIPQGITAMINVNPEGTVEENTDTLSSEIKNVKTGQLTYAVRDTVIDDMEIKKDDFMAVGDSGVLSSEASLEDAFMKMIDAMVDDDSSFISIYYGEEATEEKANELADMITEKYPDVEVEVSLGGQAVYYYIVSVE